MFLAIDLDGTLLNSDKKISAENKKAISAFLNIKENTICLATGRWLDNSIKLAQEINIIDSDSGIVCCNGAIVYSFKDKKIIYQKMHHKNDVNQIIKFANKYNSQLLMPMDKTLYINNYSVQKEVDRYKLYFGFEEEIIDKAEHLHEKIPKITIILHKEKFEEAKKNFNQMFEEKLNLSWTYENVCEIAPSGVSKGEGLKILLDYLKIKESELAVIGDNVNDISMFEIANKRYCIKNSHENLQKVANYTSEYNNNLSGVADVIDYILKNENF